MTLDLIKEQVSKSETEEAIVNLLSITKHGLHEYQDDVILLSGKFHKWKKETMLDIIDDGQRVWNKINYALLQLVSLIEYEQKEIIESFVVESGYILVRYWSNDKRKYDYTLNDDENENLHSIDELKEGCEYIVKYSYGVNLRAYLPPIKEYSNRTIKQVQLIKNLSQCTKIKVIEPIYQYSDSDYWAKVEVLKDGF